MGSGLKTYVFDHNSLVLPPESSVRRESRRPLKFRDETFADKFDFHTVFYDVFRSVDGQMILASGPPHWNLANEVKEIEIDNWPDMRVVQNDLDRCSLTSFRGSEADIPNVLKGNFADQVFRLDVGQNHSDLFAGHRVLLTKSKDNALEWIVDWAQFHVTAHGATAVLLFDNASTKYGPDEINAALQTVEGLELAVIVKMPFKFGPSGGKHSVWDSDFCLSGFLQTARLRYLAKARSVLSCDIDELVVSKSGRSIFEATERSSTGYLPFKGCWVAAIPNRYIPSSETPRHMDFDRIEFGVDQCPFKWCGVPAKINLRHQWSAHMIKGLQRQHDAWDNDFTYRHFRAINTGWKYKRRHEKPSGHKDDHVIDTLLRNECAQHLKRIDLSIILNRNTRNLTEISDLEEKRQRSTVMSILPTVIGGKPAIEEADLQIFENIVSGRQYVIEYGSGSNTFNLLRRNDISIVFSVESDRAWFDQMTEALKQNVPDALNKLAMMYVDVGPTAKWGTPKDNRLCKYWHRYPLMPWINARKQNLHIDLVIIDGRFRVACFMAALCYAEPGTLIYVDDYLSRPYYHVMAEVLSPVQCGFSGAVFQVNNHYSQSRAIYELSAHVTDYR